MPKVLAETRRRHRRIDVRVAGGSFPVLFHELQHGSPDFIVGPRPDASFGELQVETLFPNTRSIVCRAGHPLARATSISALLGQEWIFTLPTGTMVAEIRTLFVEKGLNVPQKVIQCEAPLAILSLLLTSDMIALLPRQWLEFPAFKPV